MVIIAEIGTAHGGAKDKAARLIDAAAHAGADAVKFQWVYADEILHPDTGMVQLPGGAVRLYDRFKQLEVPEEFFDFCKNYAHRQGLLFMCSPFGLRSLAGLAAIKPDAIKIASPEVNHTPLLRAASEFYGKIPLVLSSGVSTLGDIERAVTTLTDCTTFLADQNKMPNQKAEYKQEPKPCALASTVPDVTSAQNQNDYSMKNHCGASAETVESPIQKNKTSLAPLTLLHCITSYPAPETEYNVRCIKTLSDIFGLPTGISDHSLDPVLIPVLTTAMGGTMVEKHITLSRKTDGLDDPVALEPEQFSLMVHAVHQTEAIVRRWKREASALCGAAATTTPPEALKAIFNQLFQSYPQNTVLAALGTGRKSLAASEQRNYGRTNRSLHYLHSMQPGERIGEHDIAVLRTEKILTPGISPDFLETVIGCVLQRQVSQGSGVQWDDVLAR